MRRVLVGGFGAVARRGIRAVLERDGVEVVAECGLGVVMTALDSVAPDVLVLDLDAVEGSALAVTVARARPEVTVVACSADHPIMRVYPRQGGGRVVPRTLSVAELATVVGT